MYERMIHANSGVVDGSEHFALQQYTDALRDFRQQLCTPQEVGVDLALVTCVLFVCLEMLRSNNARAMDHVQGGLQILHQRLQKGKRMVNDRLDWEICQLFYRLNIQLSLFGRPLLIMNIPTKKSTALGLGEGLIFDNILQARECLTNLMNRGLAFIRSLGSWREILSEPHCQQALQEQQKFKRELDIWYAAFEALRSKPPANVGISDPRAPLLLLVAYNTTLIWLSNCLERTESSFDGYCTNFEIILYWTFHRCRHPLIRRRALEALKRYPTLEGMWDKRRNVQTAEWILAFEEGALSSLPVEQRVAEDKDRVYEALRCPENDVYPNPYPVLFWMKLNGVEREWEKRLEYLY